MEATNKVQFECLEDGGKVKVLGRLVFGPGKEIRAEPEVGGEGVLERVLGNSVTYSSGRQITKEEAPAQWFNLLPETYRGTYFWARFV